jgi:disulfide bond formation protein DsbB
MAGQRAALRLLFVLLVAAGIAGMHTLGHPSSGGHGSATHSATPAAHQAPLGHQAVHIMTVATSASEVALGGTDMSLDPSTVCLAILVAFGLAALLAALVIGERHTAPPVRYLRGAAALAGRGPPLSLRVGLRLADLSVLRT